jgi:hypothetical protein
VRGVKADAECSVLRPGPTADVAVVESAETIDEKEFQMWRICFPLSREEVLIGKKQTCFYIPIIPVSKFPRPQPEPWLTVGGKTVDIAQDLQILASIAALARDLSSELGRTVQSGIEQAASSMKEKLPEGVELHFGEQTAK